MNVDKSRKMLFGLTKPNFSFLVTPQLRFYNNVPISLMPFPFYYISKHNRIAEK